MEGGFWQNRRPQITWYHAKPAAAAPHFHCQPPQGADGVISGKEYRTHLTTRGLYSWGLHGSREKPGEDPGSQQVTRKGEELPEDIMFPVGPLLG